MDVVDGLFAKLLCTDPSQGESEEKFRFVLIDSSGDDFPVDEIEGKPPAHAGVIVKKTEISFPERLRQLIVTGGGLQLPSLFENPI